MVALTSSCWAKATRQTNTTNKHQKDVKNTFVVSLSPSNCWLGRPQGYTPTKYKKQL